MASLKEIANLQSGNFQGWGYAHVNPNGMPGSEYPLGTPTHPAQTLANARAICVVREMCRVALHGAFNLDAAMQDYQFFGDGVLSPTYDIFDLNGQDIDGSSFEDMVITGAQGGTEFAHYHRCLLNAATALRGMAKNCVLMGTLDIATGGAQDYFDFINCRSYRNAAVTVEINASDHVNFFNFAGTLILDSMTGGTVNIWAGAGATITINASCTGGTINIYGNAIVTDNSVGAVVTDHTIDERAANINDQTSGILVQVPYFVEMDTINGDVITLFAFDALGCTIREVFISFYLPNSAGTFTPTWEKTRVGDLVTFVVEVVPALAVIAVPAAPNVYSYKLGEIAQGLQGRFRIAEDANAGVTVDAFAVALMEL